MTKIIEITKGKLVLVDDEYYDDLNKFSWYALERPHTCYAFTTLDGRTILMHRLIIAWKCGVPLDKLSSESSVDHIDRNGLNNQSSNLRLVSHSENCQNRKMPKQSNKYIGVYASSCGFNSIVSINNDKIFLGTFDDEIAAAKQRDLASLKLYGKHARLNFTNERENYQKLLDTGFDPIPERNFIPYSNYSGVTYRKDLDKWQAYIAIDQQKELDLPLDHEFKRIVVGTFPTEQEAIEAHKNSVKKLISGEEIITPHEETKKFTYRGITKNPNGKYLACIRHNKIDYSLDTYETEEEAAEMYDLALVKLNGNLINLNFPDRLDEYRTKIKNGFNPIPEKKSKTSKFKGVSYRTDKKKWEAYVYDLETKKRKRLGYFETELDAATAREPIEKEINKDKAKLNFS